MRIIISPAKKMNVDTDSLAWQELPRFLPRTERILQELQKLSYGDLKNLWGCNDKLAKLNYERVQTMELTQRLTPAILSYEGIQYRHMAPGVFSGSEFDYVQEHLRILSGFYGLLKPFDGVTPYRLEMQARLSVDGKLDLYAFWGDTLAKNLQEESDVILDLASKEYSKAVFPHLSPNVRRITCIFGERKGDKIVEKGTLCKMARGEMVRFMAENQIKQPQEIKAFSQLQFHFCQDLSDEQKFYFIKE